MDFRFGEHDHFVLALPVSYASAMSCLEKAVAIVLRLPYIVSWNIGSRRALTEVQMQHSTAELNGT
jgi:hypothetical protein